MTSSPSGPGSRETTSGGFKWKDKDQLLQGTLACLVLSHVLGVHNRDPGAQCEPAPTCRDGNRPTRHVDQLGPHRLSGPFATCFPTYKCAPSRWHFRGFRTPLSCQHCFTALTLSLNYTITMLCTVDTVIKYLKCSSTHWSFRNITGVKPSCKNH